MEEAIKQGVLHVQLQQKFGKKWKKVWVLLFGESTCSVARLEYYEFKEAMSMTERQGTRKMENKKIIKLSDCIRIVEAPTESCPSECRSFCLETVDKQFVFAVESSEYEDWSQSLCELAFPMNWSDWPTMNKNNGKQASKKGKSNLMTMEENTLYGTRAAVKDFRVTVRKTEAADRCNLQGTFLLTVEKDGLQLKDLKSGDVHYTWPYKFLRRFGRDKVTFSFEAGRRCMSGEGNFEFDTRQGNDIFHIITSAIQEQKQRNESDNQLSRSLENETALSSRPLPIPAHGLEEETWQRDFGEEQGQSSTSVKAEFSNATLPSLRSLSLESVCDTKSSSTMPFRQAVKGHHSYPAAGATGNMAQLPDVQSTYSEVRDVVAKSSSRGNAKSTKTHTGKKSENQSAPESDYAIPFDAIAKTLRFPPLSGLPTIQQDNNAPEKTFSTFFPQGLEECADPLYDTIDESNIRGKANPASSRNLSKDHIYDEPEGVATPSIYDNPEEVKGHAWKLQGLDCDTQGHEYPYNPNMDDYAVPKTATQAFAKKKSRERLYQKDNTGALESEYDNVLVKISEKKGTK
ncbi:docking protein 2-like isoform X1 [Chiloscyllium plagiosum]|uniref:docking protein 2-like isoform X1 n=1 Tax=Chiloscyllium plagiosum TaxID=36176 RepID=UPI001CB84FBB|nr:docking protein 2-like isoform X1 [Chiloscyllium plagiosum]